MRRRFESTEQALVGAIVVTVADHMRAGTLDRVSEAGPELAQLVLTPYVSGTAGAGGGPDAPRPTDGGPCAGSYSLGFGKH